MSETYLQKNNLLSKYKLLNAEFPEMEKLTFPEMPERKFPSLPDEDNNKEENLEDKLD